MLTEERRARIRKYYSRSAGTDSSGDLKVLQVIDKMKMMKISICRLQKEK
jgi:hypothetical protein